MVIKHCALAGQAIQALKQRVEGKRFAVVSEKGTLTSTDIRSAYQDRLLDGVRLSRPVRVAVDCANGAMAQHAVSVLEAYGVDIVPLYCTLDGAFPNHEPDPSKNENLRDLQKCVKEAECELGLAFDGDGDRVVIVTSTGESIDSDHLLMYFTSDILKCHPRGKVVYDVKCSRAVPLWVEAHGGVPVLARTGHSYMKAAMRETKACLGGEMSGHFFFGNPWYGFDDGLYTAIRFLELISRDEQRGQWEHALQALPRMINTPEIHWRFENDAKAYQMMQKILEEARFPGAGSIYRLDGLRVEYSDGFGLIRASNTSPLITLRFEGDTQEALYRIQSAFKDEIVRISGLGKADTLSEHFQWA